jgi:hypothetical protein
MIQTPFTETIRAACDIALPHAAAWASFLLTA